MEITFTGKYKSLADFVWRDIPNFVVITGPNGSGKSQLLTLIYNTIVNSRIESERVQIDEHFLPNDVIFLKGEWQLQNTFDINLSTMLQQMTGYYSSFVNNNSHHHPDQFKLLHAFNEVEIKLGKYRAEITKDEFFKHFPKILIENESQLSQKIGEIFYDYRLSEIELLAEGFSEENMRAKIGEKPWVVLREIIREAKLPFSVNDPSTHGIRDSFVLKLKHEILNEEINFNDLSSGEKVLISLVFYLYNSQEKKIFPRILLMDEPDAHLHPSMTQQFLNVIKNVLVDKFGVIVIMTTHSPSTVMLAPVNAIYEMARTEPRIKKSTSKNHSVSLLTSGLVYVGEGTRFFLVEDKDDVDFYSYIYNQLVADNKISADIPLVFIPGSTKDKSGGKNVVQNWVKKLQDSGLENIIQGLIDADSDNTASNGIYVLDRYSIENYLIDPLLVYAVLIDKEKNPPIDGLKFSVGEEYKLKMLSQQNLQKIADEIFAMIEPIMPQYFPNFDSNTDSQRVEVSFSNDQTLMYPRWILRMRGKTVLNEVYGSVFGSPTINFSTLFKALKKINIIPSDLQDKFIELKFMNLKPETK